MALPLIQYNKNRYFLLCFFFYLFFSHVHTLIRLSKKRKHNKGINCSPYYAVFGREAYTGLEQEARLTSDQLGKIKTTHQLFTILGMITEANEEKENELLDAIDAAAVSFTDRN